MGLKGRLNRLEGSDGSACEACGTSSDGPFEFTFGEPLKWGEEPPQPEFCAGCGRMTGGAFTLNIGDAHVLGPEDDPSLA